MLIMYQSCSVDGLRPSAQTPEICRIKRKNVRTRIRTRSERPMTQEVALFRHFHDGGEGWIRTSVRLRGQIYSLLPLTTRPPLHEVRQARHVAALGRCVNALERVKGIEPSS